MMLPKILPKISNFKSPIFSHQHQDDINIIFAISISAFLKENSVF